MTRIYVWYCPECHSTGKSNREKERQCSCGTMMCIKGVEKGGELDPTIRSDFVNIAFPDVERVSHSMGVGANQVDAFRKAHPDIELRKAPSGKAYLPVIKNRPDKLRIMKQLGMYEY